MPSGIGLSSAPTVEVEPLYSAIPSRLQPVPLPLVTGTTPAPTLTDGKPEPAYADSQVTYRDLVNTWGSLRLIVGGKDVTYFRGVSAQIGGYQLQEPYAYGPADFAFPQLTSLEVDQWGTGALSWFDAGKSVQLVQVDKDLQKVRVVWRGFVTAANPTKDGTAVHCDGQASGRMTLRDRHPVLFAFTKDIGTWVFNAFAICGLSLRPRLGPKTGIAIDTRGRSGTYLSYVDSLLADAQDSNGDQWTVNVNDSAQFVMRKKDKTTVRATVFNGAHGVELDVTRDLSEEPTTFYGSGIDPDGQVWVNGRYPGLTQADAPAFPGQMQEGDVNAGVGLLTWKLFGMNYDLERSDVGQTFNAHVTAAVKDLQDDANLPQTGVVDQATWDALYNTATTGLSLRRAWQAPLAEIPEVRKYKYTGNGSRAGRNPRYKASRVPVDRTVDHGSGVTKRRGARWSQRQLAMIQNGKNWVGTLTLSADAAAGDVTFGDTITPLSRLDIAAGDNIRVRHFDGDTLFHVSGVNVDSDLTVRLAIDTKARDLLTLGQIIERNRASRINPARQWLRQHRGTDANHAIIQFSEVGGVIFNDVACGGGAWTVFPILAGQSGTINRVRLQTDAPTEFVCALFGKKIGPKYLHAKLGNPFDVKSPVGHVKVDDGGSGYTSAPTVTIDGGGGSGATATATITGDKVTAVTITDHGHGYSDAPSVSFSGGGGSGASSTATISPDSFKWADSGLLDDIDKNRVLLGAWGDASQPCGFGLKAKTDSNGDRTGAPLVGWFLDDDGIVYHTLQGNPVVWMAVFARDATTLHAQRVLWPVLEAGT